MPRYRQSGPYGQRGSELWRDNGPGCGYALLGLIVAFLFLFPSGAEAQVQKRDVGTRSSAIPTFDDFRHEALQHGYFAGWCGSQEYWLMRENRNFTIYGVAKEASASFVLPETVEHRCDSSGENIAFTDRKGQVSQLNVGSGATSVLANNQEATVSVAPDFSSIASSEPLNLASDGRMKNVIVVESRTIRIFWKNDSSMLFAVRVFPSMKDMSAIDVFDVRKGRLGSGKLPAGFTFRRGSFTADGRYLLLFLVPVADEDGDGTIFKCRIEDIKCDAIMAGVMRVSLGENIIGTVRSVGKRKRGEESYYEPARYLVEIREWGGDVLVRQKFASRTRGLMQPNVSPSGKKVVLTWVTSFTGCEGGYVACTAGFVVDLSRRSK